MNAVRDAMSGAPVSLLDVRSLRCWGLTPSGPPDDPAGKEWMAAMISSTIKFAAEKLDGSWNG
jgi:hypothetical protein